MTYEEFKKEIKRISKTYKLDLYVFRTEKNILVQLVDVTCVAISKNEIYSLDTRYDAFASLKDNLKYELFAICSELAQTPILKRKQEKRFYVRHKFLYKSTETGYINLDIINGYMILADKNEGLSTRTKFTQEEIDGIKKAYSTDLKDFEIIEVNDDI